MTESSNTELFLEHNSSYKGRFAVSPNESPLLTRKNKCSPNFQRKNVHWSDSLEEICYIPSRDGFSYRVNRTGSLTFSHSKLPVGCATYPKSVLKGREEDYDKQRRERDLSLVYELLAELVWYLKFGRGDVSYAAVSKQAELSLGLVTRTHFRRTSNHTVFLNRSSKQRKRTATMLKRRFCFSLTAKNRRYLKNLCSIFFAKITLQFGEGSRFWETLLPSSYFINFCTFVVYKRWKKTPNDWKTLSNYKRHFLKRETWVLWHNLCTYHLA